MNLIKARLLAGLSKVKPIKYETITG